MHCRVDATGVPGRPVDELAELARSLRTFASDPDDAALLDEHVEMLARYARRADVGAGSRPDPTTPASPGQPATLEVYLAQLRRHGLSGDLGLAAIARRCWHTGSLRWPSAAGPTAVARLRISRAAPTGRAATAIELSIPTGLRDRLAWRSGQHLSVHVPIGGVDVARSYSICAPAGAIARGRMRIAVRHDGDGLVSSALARHARAGATLDVEPPTGVMTWPPDGSHGHASHGHASCGDGAPCAPVLLVAAGSGITPLFAIAADALRSVDARVGLLVVERTPADVMLSAEIAALGAAYGRRFVFEGIWTRAGHGRPTPVSMAFPIADVCRRLDPEGPSGVPLVYICGPGPVAAAVRSACDLAGMVGTAIHHESFTPDSDSAPGEEPRPGGTLGVAVAGGRREVELAPGETLLAAMLRAGIEHPFSCLSGVCQSCRVKVVSGDVGPQRACIGRERDGVWTLACIASCRAQGPGTEAAGPR